MYYSLDHESKLALIELDFLPDFSSLWESRPETRAKISKFLLSKPERLLDGWEKKLEERDEFMHSRPYNEDTFEMLDKMMALTDKMWSAYLKIQKAVTSEGESQTVGDTELSLSDKGVI